MTPTVPPSLWIANLDAELHWSPKRAPRTLPQAARQRLAAVGSLFRFLARRGDALWLPAPIDPQRLPPGGAEIEIVTDSPEATLRRFAGHARRPWADAPPWIEGERAEIARRVNDRRYALELARKLGVSDERIGVVNSAEAILERARAHGLEKWVVKAPFSSSGRERHLHLGGSVNEAPIEKILRRHGELIFEPWHDRTLDVGVLFECPLEAEPRAHRQLMSPAGAVTSIELDAALPAELIELAARVAEELTAAGYQGPAGIDAWQHREEGEERWHLLGEINARWSVGHLGRQVARRLAGFHVRPRNRPRAHSGPLSPAAGERVRVRGSGPACMMQRRSDHETPPSPQPSPPGGRGERGPDSDPLEETRLIHGDSDRPADLAASWAHGGRAPRLEIGDREAFEAARENAESFRALLLPSESSAGIWLTSRGSDGDSIRP